VLGHALGARARIDNDCREPVGVNESNLTNIAIVLEQFADDNEPYNNLPPERRPTERTLDLFEFATALCVRFES